MAQTASLDFLQDSPRNLTSLGGTFVTGGERGRKGLFLQESEDSRFEQEFVTANDPLRPLSPEEFEYLLHVSDDAGDAYDEEPSISRIISTSKVTQKKILDLADGAFEAPSVLFKLYLEGIFLNGIQRENKEDTKKARIKIFKVLQMTVSAMIHLEGEGAVRNLFAKSRAQDGDSERTLLNHFLNFARREKKCRGYGHWTATRILTAIGYENV